MEENFQSKVGDLWKTIDELNNLLNAMQKNKNRDFTEERLTRMHQGIKSRYGQILQGIRSLQETTKQMLQEASIKDTDSSNSLEVPSSERAASLLATFFSSEINLKAPPHPEHCGCRVWKLQKIQPGRFVCAKRGDTYILMVVWKFDGVNTYSLYDPTDGKITITEVDKKDVTPLPVMIPAKPRPRWEHAEGTEVLSLWPEDENDWTTEFFKAKVIKLPCQRMDEPVRGYELEFEHCPEHKIVPEKFIAIFPK